MLWLGIRSRHGGLRRVGRETDFTRRHKVTFGFLEEFVFVEFSVNLVHSDLT